MAGISAVGGASVPQVQAPNQAAKAQGTPAASSTPNQGTQGDTLTISAAAISIMEDAMESVQDPKHHHRKSIAAVLLTYPNYHIAGHHPGAAAVLEGGAPQQGSSAPVAAVGSAGASAGAAGGAGGAGGGGGGKG